ncbi:MAG: sigma-70 family RNA polymerase sigma factor [Acidobacteriota bacterium]
MTQSEPPAGTAALVEHLFRHRAGQIVATITRALGPEHLDLAEDVVQEVLVRALRRWPLHGVPERPAAWLFRAAHNLALDRLRHRSVTTRSEPEVLHHLEALATAAERPDDAPLSGELRDHQLRLVFACCHPAIAPRARVALTLKTFGGFSTEEIARSFLLKEPTVAQLIVRAKRRLREGDVTLEVPAGDDLVERLDSVLTVIYLVFNEGHVATRGDALVRLELVHESLRWLDLLLSEERLRHPRVHALAALLSLLASRLPARTDDDGRLVRLSEQDRSLWDRGLLTAGLQQLELAMEAHELSALHVQAGIAALHARARTAEETDWAAILRQYDLLETLEPTPVVRLNRAVAVWHAEGPGPALAILDGLLDEPSLQRHHWLASTRAAVLASLSRTEEAEVAYREALERVENGCERLFLEQRLGDLEKDA